MAVTKKKSAKAQAEPVQKAIPLVWVGLEDTPVGSVNNTICQVHEGLFIMSFGFANPPVLVGTPAQIKEQADALSAVRVTPVARIAVTEDHMRSIVKAFQDTLKRHQKQKDAK